MLTAFKIYPLFYYYFTVNMSESMSFDKTIS